MSSDLVYAVDFGTSNSLLAAANSERIFAPIPLDPSAPDPTILRSILYFPSQKQCFYGNQAIEEFQRNDLHGRLIRSFKKYLPMRSFVGTWIENRPMNLEDIVAVFLREIRRRANEHFQKDVDSIVLGRPARFSLDQADDDYAQYRLERAARSAGFNRIEFLPEPLAAAFELRTQLKAAKIALVADFGGGTSDYTVIKIGPEPFKPSDVLAIQGIPIAGDALDGAIMKHRLLPFFGGDVSFAVPFGSNILKMPISLIDRLCSPADMSLLRKPDVMDFFKKVRQWSLTEQDAAKMDRLFCVIEDNLGFALFEEIEKAKRRLSDNEHTHLRFQYPTIDLDERMSRTDFETCVSEPVDKILHCLDETLRLAQLKPADIDLVFCTGGTAKTPILNRALVSRFGVEKVQERNNFHSIVEGLSVKARELASGL